jgi:hypothetical protein
MARTKEGKLSQAESAGEVLRADLFQLCATSHSGIHHADLTARFPALPVVL